jgi:hypothetical protein
MVFLLTLTRGLVPLTMMVTEPASPLLAVGSGGWGAVIIYLAADADTWAGHYFFRMKCAS